MKEIQTTLDNNVKQVLEDYNAYEYKVGSFQMKLNHVVAKTRIDPVEYADRLAEMFEESGEYKGYSHKKIEVQEGGAFGIFMKGSGMYQGVDMVINSVILVKDNDLWEITVILNSSSHELKILMENIFSSPIIK
ncbi:MAG: hypothetical protein C0602_03650 [Denitrovibrio sp.]|nr:MAG: hypothetical protein C0602_03650 [Denitrovibrio sp.]